MKTKVTARHLLLACFLAYGALFGLWVFRRLHPHRPAVLPVIHVEVDQFAAVEDVLAEAIALAKRNGVVVALEFDGIALRAFPTSEAGVLAAVYRHEAGERARRRMREEITADVRAEAEAVIHGSPTA